MTFTAIQPSTQPTAQPIGCASASTIMNAVVIAYSAATDTLQYQAADKLALYAQQSTEL